MRMCVCTNIFVYVYVYTLCKCLYPSVYVYHLGNICEVITTEIVLAITTYIPVPDHQWKMSDLYTVQ